MEIALEHQTVDLEAYRAQVVALLKATPDVEPVFISESKRADWGFAGEVIPPGIDTDEYSGYRGREAKVLCVGNLMHARDLILGLSVQQQVLGGLSSSLLGLNKPSDGGRFTRSWNDLRECYRSHRVYLNTTVEPYEDGYNLSMLEAMATGAPVVSLANGSSPIVDGVNGFVSDNPQVLRARLHTLLTDIDLARRLGAEGQRTVKRRFGLAPFVRRWNDVLVSPTTLKLGGPAAQPPPLPAPRRTSRTRVLLACASYPATTARCLETSLRRRHDVVTVGPVIGSKIIRARNLEVMPEPTRLRDIPCAADVDLERLISALPSSWKPDLVLWVESVQGYQPQNIPRLDCPTAAYVIDSHVSLPAHLEWAPRFDWVFVAQRRYLDAFRAAGCSRVRWLPLACDPAIHGKVALPKQHDIGFAGSATPRQETRRNRLARLAEHFDVHVERTFLGDMAPRFLPPGSCSTMQSQWT